MTHWIDTHCHLDLIKEKQRSEIIDEAIQENVNSIVTIGTNHQSNQYIIDVIQQYKKVYGTLGIHPHNAIEATPAMIQFIESQLDHKKILAVGECGYDFHYEYSPKKEQEEVFILQLEIAIEKKLPIVIHSREAEQLTMQTIEPYLKKGLKALFHSFTSSKELADFAIQYDCYFSFNGIITFKKSDALRDILKQISLDRILLETDAPYLSPVPFRGKENAPKRIPAIGEFIADFLAIDLTLFQSQIYQNSSDFYNFQFD